MEIPKNLDEILDSILENIVDYTEKSIKQIKFIL